MSSIDITLELGIASGRYDWMLRLTDNEVLTARDVLAVRNSTEALELRQFVALRRQGSSAGAPAGQPPSYLLPPGNGNGYDDPNGDLPALPEAPSPVYPPGYGNPRPPDPRHDLPSPYPTEPTLEQITPTTWTNSVHDYLCSRDLVQMQKIFSSLSTFANTLGEPAFAALYAAMAAGCGAQIKICAEGKTARTAATAIAWAKANRRWDEMASLKRDATETAIAETQALSPGAEFFKGLPRPTIVPVQMAVENPAAPVPTWALPLNVPLGAFIAPDPFGGQGAPAKSQSGGGGGNGGYGQKAAEDEEQAEEEEEEEDPDEDLTMAEILRMPPMEAFLLLRDKGLIPADADYREWHKNVYGTYPPIE